MTFSTNSLQCRVCYKRSPVPYGTGMLSDFDPPTLVRAAPHHAYDTHYLYGNIPERT